MTSMSGTGLAAQCLGAVNVACRGQVALKNELMSGEPFCFCLSAQFSMHNMSLEAIDSCVVAEKTLGKKSGVGCLFALRLPFCPAV